MDRPSTDLLRIVLVLAGFGLLLGQFLVPVFAAETAGQFPEVAHLAAPYAVAGILALAALQAGLVVIWRLLAFVAEGMVFSPGALKWVNALMGCLAVATAIPAVTLCHLLFVAGLGGPGVALALGAVLLGGIALVLLVLVMRGLLADAIVDRRRLEELVGVRDR